jgi:hypothetical protein
MVKIKRGKMYKKNVERGVKRKKEEKEKTGS